MKGLEATVISKSQWEEDNQPLRLDSEFLQKGYRNAIEAVRSFGATQFGDDDPTIIHPHEIVRNYVDEEAEGDGVWFFRAQNVRPLRINTTNKVFIPVEDAASLKRNLLQRNDVLVTRSGANRGDCAIYDRDDIAVASSHTFIIRPKAIDPTFLTVFLNSSYGKAQIDKGVYGAAQPEVAPYYLRNIWIPNVSAKFCIAIDDAFRRAITSSAEAEFGTREAEATLLDALGLADWQPPEPLSYTARAADAFQADRFDAQYFRPKYNEAIALLNAKGNAAALGSLVSLNARGRQPIYADEGLPVINSKHVRTNHVNFSDDNRFGEIDKSPVVIKDGDVLLNGTGVGTIGRAAPYIFDHDALPDNHVTVIRPNKIDPIYLSVFLNSTLGQLQIEQLIKGSSGQIELYPDDIAKITIWDAPNEVQLSVRDALIAAKELEAKSRNLLADAKRAVEIAIEDNEEAALAFLENQRFEEVL